MRATIQRVLQASVEIEGSIKAKIGKGALIFLGIKETDTAEDARKLAEKIIHLRFCEDSAGKTNLSLLDTNGQVLIISQFTLYADITRGRRPSFTEAARPEKAIPLYEQFIHHMQQTGLTVQTGEFGASMKVALVNDGPFTIHLDTSML
jgi:D-tyrosyl-tRNA(Tyr) deacylase